MQIHEIQKHDMTETSMATHQIVPVRTQRHPTLWTTCGYRINIQCTIIFSMSQQPKCADAVRRVLF